MSLQSLPTPCDPALAWQLQGCRAESGNGLISTNITSCMTPIVYAAQQTDSTDIHIAHALTGSKAAAVAGSSRLGQVAWQQQHPLTGTRLSILP